MTKLEQETAEAILAETLANEELEARIWDALAEME